MPDIRHRVVISAPLESVYQAVSTSEGISGWWTRDGVQGESVEGSQLEFYFAGPDPSAVMDSIPRGSCNGTASMGPTSGLAPDSHSI